MSARKNQEARPSGLGKQETESSGGEKSFADWAGDREEIEPLDPESRRGSHRPPPASPPTTNLEPHTRAPTKQNRWQFPDPHEPLLARQAHLRKARFGHLRAGRIRPTRTIDLHGHRSEPTHRQLVTKLESAAQSDIECVLVIHGQGHHSLGGEAVLRQALPGWLTHPSLLHRVLAFAPAQTRDGGRGAVYVLLH